MSQTAGVSIALREINKQAYCNYYSYFIYLFCRECILTFATHRAASDKKSVCTGLISRLKSCKNEKFSCEFSLIVTEVWHIPCFSFFISSVDLYWLVKYSAVFLESSKLWESHVKTNFTAEIYKYKIYII